MYWLLTTIFRIFLLFVTGRHRRDVRFFYAVTFCIS